MSRKMLIVAVTVALLLATLVAPATAASLKAADATSVGAVVWSRSGGSVAIWPPFFQPDGGCETGGAGGCPL